MRDIQKHVKAEGGSYQLAIRNIVCHLDLMTDEQKAAINWHPEQSVSVAVLRLISIDEFRAVAANDVPQAAVAVVATDDCPAGETTTRASSCSDELIAYAKQEKP